MMYELALSILCGIMFSVGNGQNSQFQEEIEINEFVQEFTQEDAFYKPAQILRREGHGQNCGEAESKLKLTWVPEKIVVGKEVVASLDMTALRGLTKGEAHITVYNGNGTKSELFNFSSVKTCEEAKDIFSNLKCPVKRGDKISIGYRRKTGQLPAGMFTVVVKIRNDKDKPFACFRMLLELVEDIN